LSSVKFNGGYAQASWVLTGETHTYNSAAAAAYGGIVPLNPFSLTGGGWGAWEIAGRISTIDLNDQLAAANGVAGGRQTVYLYGGPELVHQSQRPLHVRLPAR
jgi:phosphate-selective porin OprO/OprP